MLLSGRDLAGYIKQRHFEQVRSQGVTPKLAIIMSDQANAVIRSYVRSSKSRYAEAIGAQVDVHECRGETQEVVKLIKRLNQDDSVHGLIVQLPFEGINIDTALGAVALSKDIDGLRPDSRFDPATPKGILWILSSYGIEWQNKTVVVVGQGRVVGKPLADMLEASGAKVIRCDINTTDLAAETLKADIVVTATGQPNLIHAGMVHPGAVIIDSGTAELGGNVVGDVDHALYEDESLKITPNPGGVGPMTVAALFDNLLLAMEAEPTRAA